MYNNTDITYSFNLDNYINSLESDLPFYDYKLLIDNKDYDTISLEHDKLMNEINKNINYLDNIDIYSTEGVGDAIKKAIEWIKSMWKKLIEVVQLFLKKVHVKILEFTTRSKESLYKKFKEKAFNSLDLTIEARQLNPNLILSLTQYLDEFQKWNLEFERFISWLNSNENKPIQDQINSTKDFLDGISSAQGMVFGVTSKDQIISTIEDIFYETGSKKQTTTIKKFFNCSEGDRPKELILLSDNYLNLLKNTRKNTTIFLNGLKKYSNKISNILNKKEISNETKDPWTGETSLSCFKDLLKQINFLHHLNYSIFIEAIKVRKQVAKFILKGSLGNLFKDDISKKSMEIGDLVKIQEIFDFEVWRGIQDKEYTVQLSKEETATVIFDAEKSSIEIHCHLKKKSSLWNELMTIAEKYRIGGTMIQNIMKVNRETVEIYTSGSDSYRSFRSKNDHLPIFNRLSNLFQLPPDINKHSTLTICSPSATVKGGNFFIQILYGNVHYHLQEHNNLWHTVPKNSPYTPVPKDGFLQGWFRNIFLFTEQRIYFGFNKPMGASMADSSVKGSTHYIYKILWKNIGLKTIYRDPEEPSGETNEQRTRGACYLVAEKIPIEDMTSLFLQQEMLMNT